MAVFTYRARDQRGDLVAGAINAPTMSEASRLLRVEGKFVLDLTPGVQNERHNELETLRTAEAARRVRREDVIEFCQQLSVMLETGVPLISALKAYNQSSPSANMRRVTLEIEDEIENGSSLSASLMRWTRVFPPMVVSLVEASEASGTMGLMLSRISKYLGKELKTAKQIRGALTYPCVMISFAMVVTVFLMTFVLPRFAAIYATRESALPLPTKALMTISDLWVQHWIAIVILIAAAAFGVFMFWRTNRGRHTFDWLRLRLPIIGSMYSKLYITRAARTMGTLLAAGVDLIQTISMTRGVTANELYRHFWDGVINEVESGKQLSEAMGESDLIPGSVIQMIAAGERAGRLGAVMDRIGEATEADLDEAVAKATQYLEPAMITIMGAVIGFVAIALLLPIFTIANAMR